MGEHTKPTLFGREPALILGALNAILLLAVGFGLPVTGEQMALINAAAAAIMAVVIRAQVTPNAKVVERAVFEDDAPRVVAGPANELIEPGSYVRSL